MSLSSVMLTSKQHLEEVKASQECPHFAKNIFIPKVPAQIGFHKDKHYVLPAVAGSLAQIQLCVPVIQWLII